MIDDVELLRRYAEEERQDAFAEIVGRHIDLVYGVALRQTHGNAALAEDVTQMVFIDLARKAAAIARHTVLAGWLHTATRFAATKAIRAEARRQVREEKAHVSGAASPMVGADASDRAWHELRPVLDEVLGHLKERERAALLLRFFEGRRLAEVGARLALSEDGARSCVDRALEKLRAMLERRGVSSTSAALSLALVNQMSVAAPVGLAGAVTGAAMTSATAIGGGAGVAAALFTMSKIKVGITGALVVAALGTAIVEVRANRELRSELHAARGANEDLPRVQQTNLRANAELQKLAEGNPDAGELAKLQSRAAILRARPPGVTDAGFKLATTWRNLGRTTPEATWETFCHAIAVGDIDAVADLIVFRDDAEKDRAAFMAQMSEAVHARYRTPERVCAAAFFGVGDPTGLSPDDAFQILRVEEIGFDRVRVHTWFRRGGREMEGRESYAQTPQGWAIALRSAMDKSTLELVAARLDPATGNVRPMKPGVAAK